MPVIYQEERFPGEGDVFGLGDITYQGFISPAKPGKFIWGIGPQLGMPTGMDPADDNYVSVSEVRGERRFSRGSKV